MLSLLFYLFENYLLFADKETQTHLIAGKSDNRAEPNQDELHELMTTVANDDHLHQALSWFEQATKSLTNPTEQLNYHGNRLLSSIEAAKLSYDAKQLLLLALNTQLFSHHDIERVLTLCVGLDDSIISTPQLNRLILTVIINPDLTLTDLFSVIDQHVINNSPKKVIH